MQRRAACAVRRGQAGVVCSLPPVHRAPRAAGDSPRSAHATAALPRRSFRTGPAAPCSAGDAARAPDLPPQPRGAPRARRREKPPTCEALGHGRPLRRWSHFRCLRRPGGGGRGRALSDVGRGGGGGGGVGRGVEEGGIGRGVEEGGVNGGAEGVDLREGRGVSD